MSTADIPVILFLLLPGFIAVRIHGWITHKAQLSDLELILWLLLASFALLVPIATLWHVLDASNPTVGSVLKHPTDIRIRVAASLYIAAPLLGFVVGQADKRRWLEGLLLRLEIDLKRQQDVWNLAFRDSYYVTVYMKSGSMIYGWPAMSTTNREGNAAELYLKNIRIWDRIANAWGPIEGHIDGMWVDCGSIDRIDFSLPEQAPGASATI